MAFGLSVLISLIWGLEAAKMLTVPFKSHDGNSSVLSHRPRRRISSSVHFTCQSLIYLFSQYVQKGLVMSRELI